MLLGIIWTGAFVLFPLFNRDRLRVGDLVAGTMVEIDLPNAGGAVTGRVVRSNGHLAGYRWGIERKRVLIEKEAKA